MPVIKENLQAFAKDFDSLGRKEAEKKHGSILEWYETLGKEVVREAILKNMLYKLKK